MIVVRNIFQLEFGKAKDALALWREALTGGLIPGGGIRLLTDVVGEYYTLVFESTYEDMSAYAAELADTTSDDRWQDWYRRFTPLVKGGRREIFQIVE